MDSFRLTEKDEARCSFGDPKRSRDAHDNRMEHFNVDIRKNSALRNRSLVCGCLTGFTCAAGAIGALAGMYRSSLGSTSQDKRFAPLLIAHAFSGGVGIAFTVCRSLLFERAVYEVELQRELWEIDNHIAGEIQEMVAIYRAQGLLEEEAHMITRIFAKHREAFANLMMVEELGYSRLEPPAGWEAVVDAAIPSSIGYTLGWVLPLLPFMGSELSSARSELVALCTLAAGIFVVSVGQSEVFFGSYANVWKAVGATVWNLSAAGLTYGATRFMACRSGV
ncbi:VIT family, putative [Trypanosoma equiperdum]|uniref:VIT family n=4 Tax=Trypanozoon TaxID=39700 RepID=Q582S1_TRYB2|nr:hypothetical protein, conserved [Trypanosoma brucei gambiense DAL972]XP_844056.1 hypothetical protein, conserved [Trypanosoma brucei brucei TREU927]AAX80633.1 hypothetical protein, conserved [Trypanosoma brucei]RHW73782.1 VIT family [Trypanosoma brucei equiperdum]SCU67269.1 VIT family, putative [Trypanosoma equiperdum]AAZ10497.1 hypothetical protein, conserved [Trypanosoma brucei brucei TREU927]CBH10175.1 hypothetical protein, conserved [Trypanosoma brucei gambiense DAL972]|eukprot:XP_011772465.1 hypothetical protein, conserved [Trypanosoma brucei gambiense DAL972]